MTSKRLSNQPNMITFVQKINIPVELKNKYEEKCHHMYKLNFDRVLKSLMYKQMLIEFSKINRYV